MAEEAAGLSVLVLDPLAGPRALLLDLLRGLGHRTLVAFDWPSAEILLQREKPDALVIAFDVPGLDAAGAVGGIRRRPHPLDALPVLGVTQGTRLNEDAMAGEAGLDGLLRRPFGDAALEAALRRAIAERTPPPVLDAAARAALRARLGPAALLAADEAALDVVGRLLPPLLETGGDAEALAAAGAALDAALSAVGAITAAAAARHLAEKPGRRALQPLISRIGPVAAALRADRMTAARLDPIWAATDTLPGDTP